MENLNYAYDIDLDQFYISTKVDKSSLSSFSYQSV